MKRAFCLIRSQPYYRSDAFKTALRRLGYEVDGVPRSAMKDNDVLVIWNRYGAFDLLARKAELAGAKVVVAENGVFGRDWRGDTWYSLALGRPATVGGTFSDDGPERWDNWAVPLEPLHVVGDEVVVLAQRSIGAPEFAQPRGWHTAMASSLRRHYSVRIREHPGENKNVCRLEDDLSRARFVVHWSSGAALKAAISGVLGYCGFGGFIGARLGLGVVAPTDRLDDLVGTPDLDRRLHDRRRLRELRMSAWSTWNVAEISSGEPFARLLCV